MYSIKIEKQTQRQVDPSILYKQLKRMVERALAGNRAKKGWKQVGKVEYEVKTLPDGYIYSSDLKFKRESDRKMSDDVNASQFEYIKKIIQQSGNTPGWYIPGSEIKPDQQSIIQAPKVFAEVSSVAWKPEIFGHIYSRDAQIRAVRSAVEAAIDTKFANRFHCVLYGPPACGKTSILLAVKQWLGNDMVLQMDATSTTSAGAQRILLESAQIPPVFLCEEIEKCEEASLRWMLGVLDHRAEIRKTNFNVGNIRRDVKLLCLATVNDVGKFNTVMDGALASRFAHKIYCPRPDRKVLDQILVREVLKVNGSAAWISPTLDYCEKKQINDPRRVTAICLCGRERLLDGSYQKDLDEIEGPVS